MGYKLLSRGEAGKQDFGKITTCVPRNLERIEDKRGQRPPGRERTESVSITRRKPKKKTPIQATELDEAWIERRKKEEKGEGGRGVCGGNMKH